jgi:acyl-CoA synthetase (AMP-forming)/AMP-acid ligase II
MLDLRQYNSLGEALRAALDRWPDEICLIEADRERENARLTYRQFKRQALPLASALQSAGLKDGTRAAIIMTNQSKWLLSAYAIFFCGGVLVPLDYKLTAAEQLQLLSHSHAEFLVVEHHLWRAITQAEQFKNLAVRTVLVTEAPPNADLAGAHRWDEIFMPQPSQRSSRANAPIPPASSIPPAPAAVRKAASSPTTIISSNASRSLRSIRSGPACATSAFSPRITQSISWSVSSAPSPAAPQSCICALCAPNSFAKPSQNTKSPTWPLCQWF